MATIFINISKNMNLHYYDHYIYIYMILSKPTKWLKSESFEISQMPIVCISILKMWRFSNIRITIVYIFNLHSKSGSHSKWEFLQDDSSFPNCSLVITIDGVLGFSPRSLFPRILRIYPPISCGCPSTHQIHLQIHLSLPYIYIYIYTYLYPSIGLSICCA